MKRNLIFLACFLLSLNVVFAGYISLSTIITTDIMTTNITNANIQITNFGNEPAYGVTLSLISDHFISEPLFIGRTDVNEPIDANMTLISIKPLKEGSYFAVLLTQYTDANGYPLSTISPMNVVYKNNFQSRVFATAKEVSISENDEKKISVHLKNLDTTPHQVTVNIFLSNEFSSEETKKIIRIDPKGEKDLSFKIKNIGGLAGSNYIALISVEYEENYHYSGYTICNIKVSASRKIPDFLILGVALALILTFIILLIKDKKAKLKTQKKRR